MPDLSQKRCFTHIGREAVACCPECSRFFCRECVTEHEDRVLCSGCLPLMKQDDEKKGTFSFFFRSCLFTGSVCLLWFVFYYLGQILLKLPASFHEGTLWKDLLQTL